MYTYKHVVLIGVDGAGAFFKNADTPNIDRIFKDGSVAYDVYTSIPSISAECWGSMLHGVTPEFHRLTNSIVSSKPYDTKSAFPSVFRVIRENDSECELASFSNWNPINFGIIENDLNVYEDTGNNDAEVTDKICGYLESHSPKFMFVQFDDVDGAGHSYDYNSPRHLEQIKVSDEYIGRIYEMYEKRGFIDDTLFIVTADHGGINHGHGGKSEEEMRVMFALNGKSVEKNGAAVDMQIRDIASIVLYAFGYKQPDTWTSIVPSGVFEGVKAGERPSFKIEYEYGHRTHKNVSMPDINKISGIFSDKHIAAYIPMDKDISDVTGKYNLTQSGKLYFVDGYCGKGVRFDDGYISINDCEILNNSFTIAFWFKTGGVEGDPCIFSNKNWENGQNYGFVLALTASAIKFNIGDGKTRVDLDYPLPIDYKDGWVHAIISFDRKSNTVSFCYDFEKLTTDKIPDELKEVIFESNGAVNIGQDITGKYKSSLSAVLDEVIIIDDAVSQDDVSALAEYYGI